VEEESREARKGNETFLPSTMYQIKNENKNASRKRKKNE